NTLVLLFFPLPRPHPSPTLFPYTTLFRSRSPGQDAPGRKESLLGRRSRGRPRKHRRVILGAGTRRRPRRRRKSAGCDPTGRLSTDRKSTRLNSSHVSISYAVFCLKKKTNA